MRILSPPHNINILLKNPAYNSIFILELTSRYGDTIGEIARFLGFLDISEHRRSDLRFQPVSPDDYICSNSFAIGKRYNRLVVITFDRCDFTSESDLGPEASRCVYQSALIICTMDEELRILEFRRIPIYTRSHSDGFAVRPTEDSIAFLTDGAGFV